MFLFGSAGGAVAAAVEAQRALAAEPWPGGSTVRVRMAIHVGEVAEVGDELFGMALHHASRIMAVTADGQVVVSDTAAGLIERLEPDISLLDLGEHRLRDIVRPVRLHQAVAEGIATSFPPLKTATSDASRLPVPTTSFVGREQDLRELVDLLAARRLVTLTGVGGSGKTRLALEVARRLAERHRDGVRLVELAGLGTDTLVPEAVLGALGMREPAAGTSPTDALRAALTDRDHLLLLDNCEHLVAGVAALVSELLPACAQAPRAGDRPGAPARAGGGGAAGPAARLARSGHARVARATGRIRRGPAPGRAGRRRAAGVPAHRRQCGGAGPDLLGAGGPAARHRAGGRTAAHPQPRTSSCPARRATGPAHPWRAHPARSPADDASHPRLEPSAARAR